ncbi:Transient receptor potential channel pyrexia [Amphibalanus amphitrite]|uniref:Transient receptor potential channel pyrexia n=1 Tax=Amphibalanus amphitrite TaxID=1232801 RepID=A0A6A4W4W9_AMPAM|nr:transient receptor potential channel pyrexia-like [Amphibalanus amphitrite]XP_043234084.1 transient receptor potential channel pyrexia-like [Amphibalanus amphitrite]KAF0296921.1 Transient receptor potential channel pyrexia [Amphibalanus amphitrite]KAF0304127.1 Transient receptor potential channel pyrexia [Amphibalanus amphitrite]
MARYISSPSEDEDVLQSLLPGQLSSDFLTHQMSAIVRRTISQDGAEAAHPAADPPPAGVSQERRLLSACLAGDTQQAASALDAGADPNANMRHVTAGQRVRLGSETNTRPRLRVPVRQQTLPSMLRPTILLHLVAALGDTAMMELLLRRGARPEIKDAVDTTALHVVAAARHPIDVTIELVRLLHDWGAPLETANARGQTPVLQAAEVGNTAALLVLAELGATCDAVDHRGNTLLHLAASSGNPQTVSAALDRLPADAVGRLNQKGMTPLQVAKNRETVRPLLGAGAQADEPTALMLLKNMPSAMPDVLDRYMTTNGQPLDSSQLEVYLDYMPFWDVERKKPAPETALLRAIVDANQNELLKHPVVETFMHVKWLQIRRYFYFNFVFYVCFALLVTAYGMLRVMDPEKPSTTVVAGFTALFTFLCLLRETFQMAYSWRLYVSSIENWLELLAIGLTTALLVSHNSYRPWVNHVVAWLMLATWLEMTLMVGRFPSVGIYIYMFVRVARKLIGFLMVYSPLLVAFALSFHVLFGLTPAFKTIPLSLIKTFVMMMGEYDYDGMFSGNEGPSYPGTAHLLLILFVVSMSIITVNLLIGLTVNDIQGLFKTAGVERLRMTVIQILYIESVIYSNITHVLFRTRVCRRMQEKLALLPKLLLQNVDHHLSGEPGSPKTTKLPERADSTDTEKACSSLSGECPLVRAAFRPNEKGRSRLYRFTTSDELRPTAFTVHSWMPRNMLLLLRERAAAADRETREQVLQAEILAAVRAKTENPFEDAPEASRSAPSDPSPDGDGARGAGDGDADSEGAGADGRSRRGRRRRRKKAVTSREAIDELGQKLNTVLAAISEVSLKVGLLERRVNMQDQARLDTFYSA